MKLFSDNFMCLLFYDIYIGIEDQIKTIYGQIHNRKEKMVRYKKLKLKPLT